MIMFDVQLICGFCIANRIRIEATEVRTQRRIRGRRATIPIRTDPISSSRWVAL